MANLSYNPTCTIVLMATLILLIANDHSAESSKDYSLYEELIIPYEELDEKDEAKGYNIASDNRLSRPYQDSEQRRHLVDFDHERRQQIRDLKPSKPRSTSSMSKDSKSSNSIEKRKLSYVWSPLTEQILPIKDLAKSSLSYNDLLALTEGFKAQQDLMASKSNKHRHENVATTSLDVELNPDDSALCRTIRAPVEITKDDVDKLDNHVLRTCKGIVHINRCEGACVSLVQPSVKSRTGFRKKCSCCNEATFRRIQVRLNDCYATGELESSDQKQSTRPISNAVSTPVPGYMDVELDEPIDYNDMESTHEEMRPRRRRRRGVQRTCSNTFKQELREVKILHHPLWKQSRWSSAPTTTTMCSSTSLMMILVALTALALPITSANDDQIELAKASGNAASNNNNIVKSIIKHIPDHQQRRPPQWLVDLSANRSAPFASAIPGRPRKLIRLAEADQKQQQQQQKQEISNQVGANEAASDEDAAAHLFGRPNSHHSTRLAHQVGNNNNKAILTHVEQHKQAGSGSLDISHNQGFQNSPGNNFDYFEARSSFPAGDGNNHQLNHHPRMQTGFGSQPSDSHSLIHDSHSVQASVGAGYSQSSLNQGQNYRDQTGEAYPGTDVASASLHLEKDPRPAALSSPNIRVVFNNNPHFIIGSTTPLNRHARQPASSFGSSDAYSPTEDLSLADETKVSPAKTKQPCNQNEHQQINAIEPKLNIEHINMNNDHEPEQHPVQVQSLPKRAPPMKSASPLPDLSVLNQQKGADDNQIVDTPLEQMIKDKQRPPLNMIVSLRNSHGMMKVPISLKGSKKQVQQTVAQTIEETQQQVPEQDQENLGEVLPKPAKILPEGSKTSSANNTPPEGDIFDPQNIKPFTTKTSKTKQQRQIAPHSKTKPVQQKVAIDSPEALNPEPAVKQAADCDNEERPPEVRSHMKPISTKPEVSQQEERPEVGQQQQSAEPIFSNQGYGTLRMVIPNLSDLHNKSFAAMISDFQEAFRQQMVDRSQQLVDEPEVGQKAIPVAASRKQPLSKQQEHQVRDEQEDLMVAMILASNATGRDQSKASKQLQHLVMTVIKPPRGTTQREAIGMQKRMGKQRMIGKQQPTIGLSMRVPTGGVRHMATGNRGHMTRVSLFPESVPVLSGAGRSRAGVSMDHAAPIDFDIKVKSRPDQDMENPMLDGVPARGPFPSAMMDDVVDPDGFSSSSSSSMDLLQSLAARRHHLFKRSLTDDLARERSLEPGDRLVGKPAKSHSNLHHRSGMIENKQLRGRKSKKAANDSKIDFEAAASNSNEVSEDTDEDDSASGDNVADESNSDDANDYTDGGGNSDTGSGDEPSTAAAASTNNDATSADDDDDDSMSSDDSEDIAGFDNTDEPFNHASASSHDHSSTSFEIPQIDINPNTLKQQGCRTVLREVQEIPMNGLGAIQADGQVGSGFGTGTPVARVRRSAPGSNDNLINSRKVTSIVMTKECHFPNEMNSKLPSSSEPRPGESLAKDMPNYYKDAHDRKLIPPNSPRSPRPPAASPEMMRRSDVDIGNDASQLAFLHRPYQRQQHYRPEARTGQMRVVYLQPQERQQQPQKQPPIDNLAGSGSSTSMIARPTAVHPIYQPMAHHMMAPVATTAKLSATHPHRPTQLPGPGTANPLPSNSGLNMTAKNTTLGPAFNPRQIGKQVLKPATRTLQESHPKTRRSASPHQSSPSDDSPVEYNQQNLIGTRAGGPPQRSNMVSYARQRPASGPQRAVAELEPPGQAQDDQHHPQEEQHPVAARDSVIARKLYKPPSEDDPYHTLSYSSKNGVDPDMDQDEDDSYVMDAGEESAPNGKWPRPKGNRKNRNNNANKRRGSASADRPLRVSHRLRAKSQPHMQLSERERAALMDPNYDDTDPATGRSDSDQDSNGNEHEHEDTDADDSDLGEESRLIASQMLRARQAHLPPAHLRHGRGQGLLVQSAGRRMYHQPAPPADARARRHLSPATITSVGQSSPARFGQSFRIEHQVQPRQSIGLESQLAPLPQKQMATRLAPGVKEVVAQVNGRPLHGRDAIKLIESIQRRDDIEDADEDEGDIDGDESSQRGRKSRPRESADSASAGADDEDDDDDAGDENPDADPEYNPKEGHLPAHTKPKRVEKSFAYVHRDLPHKGKFNPDDFVVSYGRGNLQSEHEDYDSDRENNNEPNSHHNHPQAAAATNRNRQLIAVANSSPGTDRLLGSWRSPLQMHQMQQHLSRGARQHWLAGG